MLFGLPSPADRVVARAHALRVAELLSSKARSKRGLVVGEPECPYEIRWNGDDFWFGSGVSDRAFTVRGKRKRSYDAYVGFLAALKEPCSCLSLKVRLERVSTELGVDVFVREPSDGPAVSRALTSPAIRDLLLRVDLGAVRSMILSTHQVDAIVDLASPEQCARQSTVLRELHATLARWPCKSTADP